ncbi:hypothetical protein GCM10007036_21230 [Alsobacter metallidurans]|uniref:Response regulatory domain-containing protein n=1 Tax=Alsobacter metallidurans TaxID=340221 RepID=A0A917I688_9HYPH|nr:response regulator transcription factor [Alsobacter metallidurans]GGH18813.1 hypothetical protein GCM10007036_21230 [Alsobacter metallidurans]
MRFPLIRVVIVDDHEPFREGVAEVLGAEPDIEVIGQCGTARDALAMVSHLRPDVVVLDMNMPGGGLAVVAGLASTCPEVTILLLTVVADPDQIQMAVQMGAGGYLQKGMSAVELAATVRAVFRGEFLACPDIASDRPARLH